MPVVLEDSEDHQAALDAALTDKGAVELVRKFIGDASCRWGKFWNIVDLTHCSFSPLLLFHL